MAALPDLITVAQYRLLPDDGVAVYELYHGEVVAVSRPKAWHWEMQEHLVDLLKPRMPRFRVGMEFAFRAIPEFDLRAADVAAVASDRYAACDPNDNLHGAPELVIEVKSPSTRSAKCRTWRRFVWRTGASNFGFCIAIPNPSPSSSATAAVKLSALAKRFHSTHSEANR
jgi:Uma2 family endonuclease